MLVDRFDDLLPGLAAGKYDVVMSGLTRTLERARTVAFSDPYFASGLQVLAPPSTRFATLAALAAAHARVAVRAGTTAESFARATLAGARRARARRRRRACSPPSTRGEADAVVIDYVSARDAEVRGHLHAPLQPLEDRRFTVEHFAFAVRQGDADWLGLAQPHAARGEGLGRVPRARRALQPVVPVRAMKTQAPSRWSAFVERVSDRLGKSSRVFLIGLVVACGIEVAVDWNSTLYEINVLRALAQAEGRGLRRHPAPRRPARRRGLRLGRARRLSRGLFDDEDVVYVRFSDALGNTLHDRVRADYAAAFAKRDGARPSASTTATRWSATPAA